MRTHLAVESLESRTLFSAAHGGAGAALIARAENVNDPHVQATLQLVKSDGAALVAARQQIKDEGSDTSAALTETLRSGTELIAADREAIRAAHDDPTALQTAKAKLQSDRQQLGDDIAAARTARRADTAEGRAAYRTALKSLFVHLNQLRKDVQAARDGSAGAPTSGRMVVVDRSQDTPPSSSTSIPATLP